MYSEKLNENIKLNKMKNSIMMQMKVQSKRENTLDKMLRENEGVNENNEMIEKTIEQKYAENVASRDEYYYNKKDNKQVKVVKAL